MTALSQNYRAAQDVPEKTIEFKMTLLSLINIYPFFQNVVPSMVKFGQVSLNFKIIFDIDPESFRFFSGPPCITSDQKIETNPILFNHAI